MVEEEKDKVTRGSFSPQEDYYTILTWQGGVCVCVCVGVCGKGCVWYGILSSFLG